MTEILSCRTALGHVWAMLAVMRIVSALMIAGSRGTPGRLNQVARDRFVPDDPRRAHAWTHFLGVQAEWWLGSVAIAEVGREALDG